MKHTMITVNSTNKKFAKKLDEAFSKMNEGKYEEAEKMFDEVNKHFDKIINPKDIKKLQKFADNLPPSKEMEELAEALGYPKEKKK